MRPRPVAPEQAQLGRRGLAVAPVQWAHGQARRPAPAGNRTLAGCGI